MACAPRVLNEVFNTAWPALSVTGPPIRFAPSLNWTCPVTVAWLGASANTFAVQVTGAKSVNERGRQESVTETSAGRTWRFAAADVLALLVLFPAY